MSWFKFALVFLASLCVFAASDTRRRVTVASAGTDFSADDRCNGLWVVVQNEALDQCTAAGQSGTDDMTIVNAPVETNTQLPPNVPTSSTFYAQDFIPTDYINLTDDADFETTALTICTWFRFDIDTAIIPFGINKYDGTNGYEVRHQLISFRRIVALIGADSALGDSTISIDTWYHSCTTFDDGAADEICIFFNGELDATCDTTNIASNASTQDLRIGWASDGGGPGFDGHMFEVAYFDDILTDQEICQICRCGLRDDVDDRTTSCGTCSMGGAVCSNP